MSAVDATEHAAVELVDDSATFFAPTSSDLLDSLLGEYQLRRQQIDQLAGIMAGDLGNVIHYFIEGNAGDGRNQRGVYLDRLFQVDGAAAALNAAYWSKTLALTDVYALMPQKRRDEWNKQIQNPAGTKRDKHSKDYIDPPLPDFTEEAVRSTIGELLRMRSQFLAERVDGIFRGLSGDHVTNAPEAFGKRMIVARALSEYGYSESSTCGLINDLRCVVAKFMGRDEPHWNDSTNLVQILKRRWGEWVSIDGGSLRIRLYKKGTAHMEVHPDMAWRLNQILAHLYPLAIPAQFRQRPAKKAREFQMMARPLPFSVLQVLTHMKPAREWYECGHQKMARELPNTLDFDYSDGDKTAARAEAERVLAAIGGAKVKAHWQFDYSPRDVLDEIIASGCIPDKQAHQFYPTPEKLARICADLAEISDTDTVLEPSAGQGDLANFLPKDRTTCVEISPLHCAVLKAKGFAVLEADFLTCWPPGIQVDVVVMNPPFADGRARSHVEHAALTVKARGRLVAILPASAKGKNWLGAGWACEWSGPYEREFAGTSVAVVILKAVRG